MRSRVISPARFVILLLQGAIISTGAILPGISGLVLLLAFVLYDPIAGPFVHPFQSLR